LCPQPTSTLFPYTTLFRSALRKNDDATPIPLAVLAMTKDNLKRLDPDRRPVPELPSLNNLLDNLGIGSRDALLQSNRYGLLRTEDRKSTRLNSSHVKISYA